MTFTPSINSAGRRLPPIAGNLLYDILSSTSENELGSFERLFVAENCDLQKHQRYMADVYLACGCFEAAQQIFETIGHARKLGDLAWATGDFNAAVRHYSSASSNGIVIRFDQDWDRLIKLAFFQSDWPRVASLVTSAPIRPGLSAGRITLGSSERAGIPFLKMFAIALMNGADIPYDGFENSLANKFRITVPELRQLLVSVHANAEEHFRKLKKLCPPRIAKVESLALGEACSRGDTSRARNLLAFLAGADQLLEKAKSALRSYVASGDDEQLDLFLQTILLPGIRSVSHSFLFKAFGGFNSQGARSEWLIRLYQSHPIMDKRYFGELLHLKFMSGVELTSRDVLTGIFQKFGRFPTAGDMGEPFAKRTLNLIRLTISRDWAEMRLKDWVEGPGQSLSHDVSRIWRDGTPETVSGAFGHHYGRPDSPRSMVEWDRLVNAALVWLESRWTEEVGLTPWHSENKLFELLKKAFKGREVQRHARPLWLIPQHLDIFIPELSLGIEYMGQQHYEPIGFFGGEAGFLSIIERDKRKLEICRKLEIAVEYVRYDEPIARRVHEIRDRYDN